MLSKPSPINEEQQPEDEVDGCELNGYAEDKGIESKFRENLCEELDIKEHLNEEVSKEEAKEDRPSSVCELWLHFGSHSRL
ncbi:hypothetical protein HispidOSU_015203 [Sigmodon hispidus]